MSKHENVVGVLNIGDDIISIDHHDESNLSFQKKGDENQVTLTFKIGQQVFDCDAYESLKLMNYTSKTLKEGRSK